MKCFANDNMITLPSYKIKLKLGLFPNLFFFVVLSFVVTFFKDFFSLFC